MNGIQERTAEQRALRRADALEVTVTEQRITDCDCDDGGKSVINAFPFG